MAQREAVRRPTETEALHDRSTPYRRQTRLFLLLLFVSLALRVWLLIVSRHYLRSDEAVTAMEALDIMEGGPIPFFHYGQPYGGGHTVEALMAIPWFALFGPADYWFKLGPLLLSCLYILVVYLCLYKFFDKRCALVAAALFGFFAPFLAFNFYNNGGSATTLFGWVGLYFFFRSYFAEADRLPSLVLSGAALGFAYYCFDYALYYLFAVLMLWALKENLHLWRRWRAMISVMAGFLVGAAPLIYYNLTHEFANLKHLLSRTAKPDAVPALEIPMRFVRLLYHDLPAFFSLDVEDFPAAISPLSYLAYGLFVLALLYSVSRTAPAVVSMARSFWARKVTVLVPEQRVVYLVLFVLLYFAIYSLAHAGGKVPRYLIVLCPLIPALWAWAACDLGKRRFIPAAIFVALFGALQVPFIVEFAKDKTVPEWGVRTHGEDIKTLANFLLDNDLTTVVTPYEIKWKLMFETRRKIVCAAYLFGYDREEKYNLEVIDRVNRRGVVPAFVFDKDYQLAQVALHFNPKGAFDVAGFHEFLKRSGITYKTTPVGRDYIVYHGFSKPFRLIGR
ncbi:MAG TPA: glycosyltransferase family 39 protein [Candidatus Binatia bacterium]